MRRFLKIVRKIILWFLGLSIGAVILFKWVPVPFTPLMITRAIENKWEGKEMICNHDWVPLDSISVNLQRAVIASEDGTFEEHWGFDFTAMQKAFKNNQKGRRIKGGSTISQQTAKNVFLWQGRSYVRKIFEAYFTVLIEVIWGKERIMEVYLNSIEMGEGVYGAEAAAQYWYGHSVRSLTKREAAGIAAILPNPRKYKPVNSSNYIERRKDKILRIMRHVKRPAYLEP
ncbi:monofunctional biosynthetic peptidoglycan transglycosylase [Flavobacterium fontis]|jgi:monofunctional biosynthetic peptidoglycan transglycosylase|uniref:Biosynthetic peptidoglycan transglycosylase n=1 Tax=Flavobacterium fontis TaxID=1124188 RepID=A0A1M4YQM9_9FLAO|nr:MULTISPECIES: monofunctional biosynthetic peptidoglycan transglycosylase [Flavobacterium]MCZ8167841.1 monofunctional biosynthetic peptidoglycan transglycosylase [Flavobacterium sp.]MCZ8297630.1 monofunctional biosynthetic peptidoglycan transglycosylase [Flavobacterium sp.]SHF08105.1 monofunctional biosynthetic peptidoglycan transglycosylase [Flavobacterium fontis]